MAGMGEILSTLRKQKGVTQEEMGKALGVSMQAVSRWENGGAPEIERSGSNWGIRGWREESGRMRWALFCAEGLFAGKILVSPGRRTPEAKRNRP